MVKLKAISNRLALVQCDSHRNRLPLAGSRLFLCALWQRARSSRPTLENPQHLSGNSGILPERDGHCGRVNRRGRAVSIGKMSRERRCLSGDFILWPPVNSAVHPPVLIPGSRSMLCGPLPPGWTHFATSVRIPFIVRRASGTRTRGGWS